MLTRGGKSLKRLEKGVYVADTVRRRIRIFRNKDTDTLKCCVRTSQEAVMSQKAIYDALTFFSPRNRLYEIMAHPEPLMKDGTLGSVTGAYNGFTFLDVPLMPHDRIRYIKSDLGYSDSNHAYVIVKNSSKEVIQQIDSPHGAIDFDYSMEDYGYVSLSGAYAWVTTFFVVDSVSVFNLKKTIDEFLK